MTIKAIETQYAGCRFRSRLEARWAVFFDALDIPWEYEPEGYVVNGSPYLPDFLIRPNTDQAFWLEFKGTFPSDDELDKAKGLAQGTGRAAFVYWARPEPPPDTASVVGLDDFDGAEGWGWSDREGWIPQPQAPRWQLGLTPTAFRFNASPPSRTSRSGLWWWTECPHCHEVILKLNGQVGWCPRFEDLSDDQVEVLYPHFAHRTPRLLAAYAAARSARFEHGERPKNRYGAGTMCPAQGVYRNAWMVKEGHDVAVAVYASWVPNAGTADCTRRIRAAGIRLLLVHVERDGRWRMAWSPAAADDGQLELGAAS